MKRKSLKLSFLYNAIYNGLNVLFPLITIPYVSRILLSNGLGKVNFATNIVSWFLLFAALGIPRYGVREIAKNKDNKTKLNKTFSELFLINAISTLISYFIYIIIIFSIPFFHEKIILFMVISIQLALNIFNVDWFYQGIEEYKYITNRSFVIKLISLLSIILFVKTKDDYIIYALIQSLAIAGNHLFNMFYLKKYANLVFQNLVFRHHIKPILILVSTQLAVSIYSLLDTTMLGIWTTESIVGYYSNVHKVIKTISIVAASLGGVMLPRFVEYIKNNDNSKLELLFNKVFRIVIFICLPMSIGLFMTANDVVTVVFGNDFLPSIPTMKIFSFFIFFTTVGNLFGTQLLMAYGQEKKILNTVLFGSIINFSLNLLLITNFKHNGVAFSSVFTEFVVMMIQYYYARKFVKINIDLHFCLKIVASNLIMIISLLIVNNFARVFISSMLVTLFLEIVVGCLTYLLINKLLKNETIIEFESLIMKIIRKH